MKKLLPIMLMLSFAASAYAAAPEYDIKASCKEVASSVGGSSVIELQCRKDEAAAKSRVETMQAPTKTLNWCNEVAATMGAGSYVILEQCLKDELKAAQQLQ